MASERGDASASAARGERLLSRRQLLAAGAGILTVGGIGLTLAGCAAAARPDSDRPGAKGALEAPPHTKWTIEDLFATAPFYVAHRGSGDNWPEHTMEAYRHCVKSGAKAIEVSVNATKDGVLICHHDTTTERTSGQNLVIANTDWGELQDVTVDARAWLGPAAAPQPIPLLKDVLDAFAETHVIFIEDKQGTNTGALLTMMDSYADSTKHFVWKEWAGAQQHTAAAARGYRTWGYFTPGLMPRLESVAGDFDYLGMMHTATDADIARAVAVGKPVIVWEVHYRSMRDRLLGLGVVGLMCSNLPYVTHAAEAVARHDAFASGLRAAGDLPWTVDQGWSLQPTISQRDAVLIIAHSGTQSYLMGSMAPLPSDRYTISARLRWPTALPGATEHVGIAFGQGDDRPYRVGVPAEVSGYHAIVRANGALQLYSRAAGTAAGTLLQTVDTEPPRLGKWVSISIRVDGHGIDVTRKGRAAWKLSTQDQKYRGGYFWLCKNYNAATPVEFSDITVS